MKLSVKGLSIASALLWGGAVLIVGTCNLIWSSYGMAFLNVVSSIYPGYRAGQGFGSVVVGTFYGILDGAVGGALLAFLYNRFTLKT